MFCNHSGHLLFQSKSPPFVALVFKLLHTVEGYCRFVASQWVFTYHVDVV